MIRSAQSIVLVALLSASTSLSAQRAALPEAYPDLVDNTEAARAALAEARVAARSAPVFSPAERARRMVELGMWGAVDSLLANVEQPGTELQLAAAELHFQRHEFAEAERVVHQALTRAPDHRAARLLQARLEIQAWRLDAAEAIARDLLAADPRDEAAALILGRLALLTKDFDSALGWAKTVRKWNSANPDAYLLEAETRFWAQDPAGAEAPLTRALALDPFDADARFNYGYAIWRRVDATQLDDMAAQWDLALEVDPLHYLTHWHWGNGHTNLTYADYALPSDSIVRERLEPADSLISEGQITEAIAIARRVQREYPESVLPSMLRGSAFYMNYPLAAETRLDSAQAAFEEILVRKTHYGPAHNGLAAVIKQRQFQALTGIDSLEAVIAGTPLPEHAAFLAVFSDVDYYPGERVRKMVRSQLGPSVAYVPFLERMDREFVIPPLHKDLAEAMGRPFFRTSTTFDNRQWMDIRGVGSGATGVEYVERGSHWERNVVAHEYTHLFHGEVLTDTEVRRIRDLYHTAMRESRTLDYYASNNESEFFAQAYEAYLSSVKAHPLTHKAMNTREDLRLKDPATYVFVDSLVARQMAYLAGDSLALGSNWAQVYVNLSQSARGGDEPNSAHAAEALLDSALIHDSNYLPAMLSYAALERDEGRFRSAAEWLERAEAIDPGYAPIYAARASVVGARARTNGSAGGALDERVALLRQALSLEEDLAERARLSRDLRQLYLDFARIPEALRAAEEYAASAPTFSTYLRDRRDEAAAFGNEVRASIGYAGQTLSFFSGLVGQKPQNYGLRSQYADALVAAGQLAEALETLNSAQRILRAGGTLNAGFASRSAAIHLMMGDTAAAREEIAPLLDAAVRPSGDDLIYIRVLAELGEIAEVESRLAALEGENPYERSRLAYTGGFIRELQGNRPAARDFYTRALAENPYHFAARVRLMELLGDAGEAAEVDRLRAEAASLPLGPAFNAGEAPPVRMSR